MASLVKSQSLFEKAKKKLVGGVNSPVRSFKHVNGTPIFIDKAMGAYLIDADGNIYIDYVNCWGAIFLGHGHKGTVVALTEQIGLSLGHGACSHKETELAELICGMMPAIEKVRLVNSGTEATMTAIRLARGYTKKDKIIKFSGCYHGHSDNLLVEAGSGLLTLNIPQTPGIPQDSIADTLVAPYNDIESVQKLITEYSDELAAVIIEPIAGNNNMIFPKNNFLQTLRDLCDQNGCLLIFDEVMTGFRVAQGGAQEAYQITPDLTCLGKVIGGGLPIGAVGGPSNIMDHLAPSGDIYQAGTLSGNPVALTAGICALSYIKDNPDCFSDMGKLTTMLTNNISDAAEKNEFSVSCTSMGAMFGFKFENDTSNECFKALFSSLIEQGIYIAPSPYEAGFISIAHTKEDIEKTTLAFNNAFIELSKKDVLNVYRVKANQTSTKPKAIPA